MFNKRNSKINNEIHKISRYFTTYCIVNKIDTVIVGYLKNWKQKCNLGKVTNQNFVQLPFLSLINKMKYKLNRNKIKLILQNEGYTSKCDALSNESITKHKKYKGTRIKRGLYRSGYKNILINADLNASINIYRKAFNFGGLDGKILNKVLKKKINRLQQIRKIKME